MSNSNSLIGIDMRTWLPEVGWQQMPLWLTTWSGPCIQLLVQSDSILRSHSGEDAVNEGSREADHSEYLSGRKETFNKVMNHTHQALKYNPKTHCCGLSTKLCSCRHFVPCHCQCRFPDAPQVYACCTLYAATGTTLWTVNSMRTIRRAVLSS